MVWCEEGGVDYVMVWCERVWCEVGGVNCDGDGSYINVR